MLQIVTFMTDKRIIYVTSQSQFGSVRFDWRQDSPEVTRSQMLARHLMINDSK